MIEIKNLTKKFGGIKVLDDISFTVKMGEILGFLGPNGAGKTTTMKIITSFWRPNSGSVLIDGLDNVKNSLEIRKKIGYLSENVPLYDEMLVTEYLKFVAQIRGIKNEKIKSRIKEVVELCGLEDVKKKPIDELSKGYRQRVGLAQAIIHNPDILILDEPTTGLDPNQIIEIRDLIKKIGQEKTIIFSTHILSEARATCDRIIIINKGKVVGEGRPEELISKAGQKEIIYVKIKGDKEKVLSKIKMVDNIESAVIKDKENEEIYGYEIIPKAGKDIREALSKAIMESGWNILEFKIKSADLEDVFRKLTK